MNTTKISRLAAIALFLGAASSAAVACSGDDNNGNPAPSTDSGTGSDVTMQGDDSSMGTDSTTPPGDSTSPIDAPSLDTGSCKSDGGTCNSCYTAAQAAADPYNGCSTYTAACIPFDPTRVPTHPQL